MTRRPTFYFRDEYVSAALAASGFRHTFDVERPRRIRDALVADGCLAADAFVAAPAATDGDLATVHTPEYIETIKDPAQLARLLLLDPALGRDDGLLAPFRYATGATIAAAQSVVRDGAMAVNLAGGYHHAQADKCEGFCAIADVAVAIRSLRADGFGGRVLIVDLDYHHGNGNALIFADDESVFTLSLHGVPWCFLEKENNRDVLLPPHVDDATYMTLLEGALDEALVAFEPELAFYVAGSDPWVEDTLGEADLTERGLFERDRFVTERLRARACPTVVVTAGGYGAGSWRIYFNYFRWLAAGSVPGPGCVGPEPHA